MDVFQAMKGRQSIRKFRKDPVPREKILRMVEAATWAPSAGNAQNARYLVVEDAVLLVRMKGIVDDLLSRVTGRKVSPDKINYHNLFAAAPVAVCVVGKPYESATDRHLRVNAGLQSVAASITQFLLAAHSLGYGTCWMTGPLVAKPELESALSIRPPEELLTIIALGVPESSPPPKPSRKPPEEITEFR
jgi:nitroreductase